MFCVCGFIQMSRIVFKCRVVLLHHSPIRMLPARKEAYPGIQQDPSAAAFQVLGLREKQQLLCEGEENDCERVELAVQCFS